MKQLSVKIAVMVLVLVLLAVTLIAKEPEKEEVLAKVILQSLDSWHYNPQDLNDQFSQRVFTLYLKNLDPNKRFLLKSDVEQLKQYQFKIDDELKDGTADFYDLSWSILKKRIDEVNGMTQDMLKKPFNFGVDESFETDPEKISFTESPQELKEQWRLNLKYQTLLAYLEIIASQNKTNGSKEGNTKAPNLKLQPFQADIEVQAREKVSRNLKRSFERLLQENEDNRLNTYINAIAGSFDPHTEYMLPQQKEDFDINMSGTLEGIGALLKEDGDYIKVSEIVPGSPAWRQKQLQAEDIILKVAQGDGEPVDVVGMPVNEAVQLIRGKKGTQVRLTVKKPDGQIMIIPIIRDVVVLEETYAKSAIISNTKTGKKYGYVYLPSFYHDLKNNSRNSADDVRTELKRLKNEKVNGVILDLRNNGGGSLDDAVAMSGLFIKKGPIVQVKDSTGQKEILTDPDPGIVYTGPLVILINTFSASASEILAAALQDYGRATIIGGPGSFGKGTVQVIVDLDRVMPRSMDEFKPAGSLKLTIKKFYRVNGGSTQSKGVIADIPLPGLYDYLEVGERKLDYSLAWDTIDPVSYQKWENRTTNLTRLKLLSAKRVQASKAFKLINTNITRLKKQHDNSRESLKFSDFLAEQQTLKEEADTLTNLPVEQPSYIKFLSPKGSNSDGSNGNNQKLKDWFKQIGKDAYINEAWHVLQDIPAQ